MSMSVSIEFEPGRKVEGKLIKGHSDAEDGLLKCKKFHLL
mgnify:FL=1